MRGAVAHPHELQRLAFRAAEEAVQLPVVGDAVAAPQKSGVRDWNPTPRTYSPTSPLRMTRATWVEKWKFCRLSSNE